MDLAALAEKDLKIILEGDWSGQVTITKIDNPTTTQTLPGQVLNDYIKFEAEDGGNIIDHSPMVTLRISTLETIPQDGENWYFDVPESPVAGAPNKRYVFDNDAGRRGFASAGMFSYPLKEYEDKRS